MALYIEKCVILNSKFHYNEDKAYVDEYVEKVKRLLTDKYSGEIEILNKSESKSTNSTYIEIEFLNLPSNHKYKKVKIRISDHPRKLKDTKHSEEIVLDVNPQNLKEDVNLTYLQTILDMILEPQTRDIFEITLDKREIKSQNVNSVTGQQPHYRYSVDIKTQKYGSSSGKSSAGVTSAVHDAFAKLKTTGVDKKTLSDIKRIERDIVKMLRDNAHDIANKNISRKLQMILNIVDDETFSVNEIYGWLNYCVNGTTIMIF